MSRAKRRKARVDDNQAQIVAYLRSIPGVSVMLDMDDILVGYQNFNYWFEIKDPEKTLKKDGNYRKNAIKDQQKTLMETWNGHYDIVSNINEIMIIMGIKKAP